MAVLSAKTDGKVPSGDKLGKLFCALYPDAADSPADPDSLAELLKTADLSRQDAGMVAAKRLEVPLDARQTGVLRLAQTVLTEYFSQPVFHPSLRAALLANAGPLLVEALPSRGWLMRADHPLAQLLSHMAGLARGWWPEAPEAADHQRAMQAWLKLAGKRSIDNALAEAEAWCAQMQARREKVTARVRESEQGAIKLRHAQQHVARNLNNQLRDRQVPGFMVDFLETWVSAFQYILLNEGENSPSWVRLSRSFALLIWSLQPAAAEPGAREKLNRVAAELKQELRELLGRLIGDDQTREELLEAIQMAHFWQQQGRELDWCDAPLVEGGSALDEAGASISQDLMAEVSAVSEGDWFEVTATGRRLQLLLKQDALQQLLFINQRGTKELVLSFEEFAWQFSTAEVSALVEPIPLQDWVASRLETLAEKYREVQRSRAQRARDEQAREARQREEREASWRKAKAEADRLATLKAEQAEADERQQAEETAREAPVDERREAAAAAHGSTPEQRRKRARLLVSGLTMGAWLDFYDGDRMTRRKLAVVLPSSGKYIFVEGVGGEKYELERTSLISGIAEGDITLVRKDARLDDSLSRIMKSNSA